MLWWAWLSCVSLVEVQSEWAAYRDQLPTCSLDTDCVIVEPGCPLGCYAGVPNGFQAEAQRRAEELADRFRQGWRPCVYECGPRPVAICNLETASCATGAVFTPLPE